MPDDNSEPIAAKYAGAGEFFGGIPATHLTLAQWEELTPGQREICVTSRLYVVTDIGFPLLPQSPALASVKPNEPFVPPPDAPDGTPPAPVVDMNETLRREEASAQAEINKLGDLIGQAKAISDAPPA